MAIICYDSERNLLEQLYQWDVNQTISVTGINTLQSPVFHFCNQRSEVALVVMPEMVNGMLTAEIPNSLLQEPETLFVYIYYDTGDDGRRTFYRIRVPVIPRQRPQNYVDTENVNFVSAEILDAQLVTLIASMAENASANMLAEVEDIRHGYDGTTYQSAGDAVRAIGETLSQTSHEPNVFSFEDETEYNRYYSNNTGSIRPGDFVIIGDNSVFIKMRNSLELLFTTNDLYRKPIDGIPFEDLSADLQLRISEGGGSVTGPTYIIQGNNSRVFGFASETAFTQYKALNPNDIHSGDYVWIKETTPFTKSYHLYVIDSQATGGRTSIFDIDDTLLITVQPGGVYGSWTSSHYLSEILQAYYNGTSISLLTDYGVVLAPSKYNTDNYNNPVSVDFSGIFEHEGVYYGITYTIDEYSVKVSRRALSKVVIEIESTATEGVYTIYNVNGQMSWSNLNLYIENMMHNENAAVVLHIDGGAPEYPCIHANQFDAYFGAFDPFSQMYVLFSILRSNSTCTRNEIPFSSSQGSGSSATITDGSILRRHLAVDVQASLSKADSALQSHQDISGKLDKNQGVANSGRPLIVGNNGNVTVGSFPASSGGYSPPTGGIPQTDLAKDVVIIDINPFEEGFRSNRYPGQVNASVESGLAVEVIYQPDEYTEIQGRVLSTSENEAVFEVLDYTANDPRILIFTVSYSLASGLTVHCDEYQLVNHANNANIPAPTAQQLGCIPVVGPNGTIIWADPADVLNPVEPTPDPTPTLTGISASYVQGSTIVTPSTQLDSLKASLTVIASYSDSTSRTLSASEYTLSGTLVAGTSTITVSSGGQTDTFTVAVTVPTTDALIYEWDFTQSLVDGVQGVTATPFTGKSSGNAPSRDASGVHFTDSQQALVLFTGSLANLRIEVDVDEFDFQGNSSNNVNFLGHYQPDSGAYRHCPIVFYSGGWNAHGFSGSTGTTRGTGGGWGELNAASAINAFDGRTVKLEVDADGHTSRLYLDNELAGTIDTIYFDRETHIVTLGGHTQSANVSRGDQCYNMTITGVRVYQMGVSTEQMSVHSNGTIVIPNGTLTTGENYTAAYIDSNEDRISGYLDIAEIEG